MSKRSKKTPSPTDVLREAAQTLKSDGATVLLYPDGADKDAVAKLRATVDGTVTPFEVQASYVAEKRLTVEDVLERARQWLGLTGPEDPERAKARDKERSSGAAVD